MIVAKTVGDLRSCSTSLRQQAAESSPVRQHGDRCQEGDRARVSGRQRRQAFIILRLPPFIGHTASAACSAQAGRRRLLKMCCVT